MMYDLIVIGAGPGGCAAAITAARTGATVLLLERGSFPRHKVCGEFVSAESLELLSNLLADEYSAHTANALRIGGARVFADATEISAEILPAAASITRFDLDRALWNSAVESGAETKESSTVKAMKAVYSGFEVSTKSQTFRSRALINAAGRWSFLTSKSTRAQASASRLIGVKAHFREPHAPATVDLYFFRGGYCGVQPIAHSENGSGTLINACALVKADIATDLNEVLLQNPALRQRSKTWTPVIEPVSTAPLVFHQPEPVQDNIFQVGDAATFVDPFIGDGISLALRSGHLVANCLMPFVRGECALPDVLTTYAARYHRELAPVFRRSSQLRSLLAAPAFLRRPVMSILQRTPAITRKLVRMTR